MIFPQVEQIVPGTFTLDSTGLFMNIRLPFEQIVPWTFSLKSFQTYDHSPSNRANYTMNIFPQVAPDYTMTTLPPLEQIIPWTFFLKSTQIVPWPLYLHKTKLSHEHFSASPPRLYHEHSPSTLQCTREPRSRVIVSLFLAITWNVYKSLMRHSFIHKVSSRLLVRYRECDE